MESRPPQRWAPPPGPLTAPWLLGLLLSPWTVQLAGGQSVVHLGSPIMVSLANKIISFSCNITYPCTPEFQAFKFGFYYVNLQDQQSSEERIPCQPSVGTENQTCTTKCEVTATLPSSSATGTYYCSVRWLSSKKRGSGTFILVRDTGYREPPQSPKKLLFFCFIGLLSALSILATALVLWKKKQMQAPWKQPARKCPALSTASPEQPPAESLYTALQRQDTEVYACMQNEDHSPPSSWNLLSQEKPHMFENDSECNQVYENL